MAKKKVGNQSPLLLKVMARFGEVTFKEQFIPGPDSKHYTYGLWEEGDTITINPIPSTVDTVVHEILHAIYPTYSERTILSLTRKLMRQLSDEQLQTIYAEYKSRLTN